MKINYFKTLEEDTFTQWAKNSILNTIKVQGREIHSEVDGVNDINILNLNITEANSLDDSSLPAIGLGVGLSAAALLVGGCFVKRKGGLSKSFNPRTADIEYMPESDTNDDDSAEHFTLYRLSAVNPNNGFKPYESMAKKKSNKKIASCTEDYDDVCFPLRCLPASSAADDSEYSLEGYDSNSDKPSDELSQQGIEIELIDGFKYDRTSDLLYEDTVEL